MAHKIVTMVVVGLVVMAVGAWLYAAETAAPGKAEAPKAGAKADAPKGPAKPPAPKPAEEADDGIQGLYVGQAGKAEVIGQGGGGYRVNLYVGGENAPKIEMSGKLADGKVDLIGNGKGQIADKKFSAEVNGAKVELAYTTPKSPTELEKPPAGAIILLAYEPGKAPSIDEWTNTTWVANPDGTINKGKGDTKTKKAFGDYQLHLEFMCPYMPTARGQGRGNSGVYQMDRIEVQILDSFGLPTANNEVGGIYTKAAPRVQAAFPPLVWQTYDITFHAPRFKAAGEKEKGAVITVLLNGVKIHDNFEIPGPTGGASKDGGIEVKAGPLRLQDHGNTVKFRNIWIKELKD